MKPLTNLAWFVLFGAALLAAVVVAVSRVGYGVPFVAAYAVLVLAYWAIVLRGLDARKATASQKLSSTLMSTERLSSEAI